MRSARPNLLSRQNLHDSNSSHEEFLNLFDEAYSQLYGLAVSLVGKPADADDVIQEASLILWEKFDQFEAGTSFHRWAVTVVANVAKNWNRKQRRRRGRSLSDEAIGHIAKVRSGNSELLELRRELLDECIDKLPKEERSMLWQCMADAASVMQWAKEHHTSHNTVYSKLRRIRQRLYHCVLKRLEMV
ncbi:sigma-70 family RNA polymerase sigma factor [Calycomorphotria hydatis]|uniref:ECF RNA polymerase sigma factor SigH n=1 Tax=Calycomorphotria hydatis TaxID=2528027 RepID=A0A517T4S9_9PLAN|nr:sigma-70 family RNA polymerase sigma factor [Calycomorphotria hydatis]QDT63369.1 ECF RNA polymerase sigma factor SigH [Calycomorphotria hydatis]